MFTSSIPRWVAVLLLANWFGSGAPALAQTTLRYKFHEGQRLTYIMEHKTTLQTITANRNTRLDTALIIDVIWGVTAVDKNGKANLRQRFDRVRYTKGMSGQKVEFDSKGSNLSKDLVPDALYPLFEALAGAEFSLTMGPQGQIADVVVPPKVREELKRFESDPTPIFTGEYLKRLIRQSGLRLPDGPVATGKPWNQEAGVWLLSGPMKMRNTLAYEGSRQRGGRQLQQISFKPEFTLEFQSDGSFSIKLNRQEAKGTAYFDNDAGHLLETNLSHTMELGIAVRGQFLTQKYEQTLCMKLSDMPK